MSDPDVNLILDVDDCVVFKVRGSETEQVAKGRLELIEVEEGRLYFISVGDWRCPIRKTIPTLRRTRGLYMFPFPGNLSYGVQMPAAVKDSDVRTFELFLKTHSAYATHEIVTAGAAGNAPAHLVSAPSSPTEGGSSSKVADMGHKLAGGISKGAVVASGAIVKGAEKVGGGIRAGGSKLKEKINPNAEPTQVKPETKENLEKARAMTTMATKVTAGMVKTVIATSQATASSLAKAFTSTSVGSKVSSAAGPKTAAAKDVALSSLAALGELYVALDRAGRILLVETGDAVSEVIEHKYGEEAGQTAATAAGLVQDVGFTTMNIAKMGPRSVLGRTARNTAIEILKDEEEEDGEKEFPLRIDPAMAMMAVAVASAADKEDVPATATRATRRRSSSGSAGKKKA